MLESSPIELSMLYRGRLSSCNYDCAYCPFAKRKDTRATLQRDAEDLARFVDWVASADDIEHSILFTPWGESLVRRHYREAMIRLSHLPHLRRVAVQTNLCIDTRWLARADLTKLALWCTYHPSQVSRADFLARCQRLRAMGVRFSVGMVAMREDVDEIDALRSALPEDVYFWLNAYDERAADYYDPATVRRLSAVDPWFVANLQPPASLGASCHAGETVISVDGDGAVTRCHFVKLPMGNLYDGSFRNQLRMRVCPNASCDCFIGYIHRKDLPIGKAFDGGRLERVPAHRPDMAS